jgi:hypothetical protein
MALSAKWQFMDRSVIPKMLYGPQLHFGKYNILGVTDRSKNCHMTLSAMNCLYIIICKDQRENLQIIENKKFLSCY